MILNFLLQIPSVSGFFMTEHTREAYETGVRTLELRKELEAQSLEQKVQETPKASDFTKPKKKKSK